MRKKDRLHRKALRTGNQSDWEAFKNERNLVSRLVKESHSDYLNNVIGASLEEPQRNFGLISAPANRKIMAFLPYDLAASCVPLIKIKLRP